MRCKKYIYIIFVLIGIGLVFSFSMFDAQTSGVMSDSLGMWIVERFPAVLEHVPDFYQKIRKVAHFAEFFVLGVGMYLVFRQSEVKHKVVWSVVLCVLVGCMDETIQFFFGSHYFVVDRNNKCKR